MVIERVISGFQTGADQAGIRAAKAAGVPTGGWIPKGFLTEDGPRPEFTELYGAKETASPTYPQRTRMNVEDSHVTIWFGNPDSASGATTLNACVNTGRTFFIVVAGVTKPSDVARLIVDYGFRVVNIAGNRESSNPGIGERTEHFMAVVFRLLAKMETRSPAPLPRVDDEVPECFR